MNDNLIGKIEMALGPDRLSRLRRDEDAYQTFWLGVLEAIVRADCSRDQTGFLISNGYGAVRNMRRGEASRGRLSQCLSCGAVLGYRTVRCPDCGGDVERVVRVTTTASADGGEVDYPDLRYTSSDASIDVGLFLETLSGMDLYVARRIMADRADLLFANHLKQIAFELGVSSQRVSQVKARVRDRFRRWYYGT